MKNKVRSFFPPNSMIKFRLSGERREEQKRLYAEAEVGEYKYFSKSALISTDKFYEKERTTYHSSNHIGVRRPRLLMELPRTNVFEFIYGERLSSIVRETKGRSELQMVLYNVVEDIALFHSRSHKDSRLNSRYLSLIKGSSSNLFHVGYMHGDLSPSNIIVNKGKVTIVDWEDFKEDGVCELDALHFFVMLGVLWFSGNRKSMGELVKMILYNKKFGSLINKLFSKYCKITGYKKGSVMGLLPLYCKSQIMRLEDNRRDPANFIYPSLITELENFESKRFAW